ncbi:FAD-dependent oxidoreductase [Deinococcus sp. DB0503]|uniref:FAD-dependent oxidoreductase n=1 Tax=Deinococcus sp. DB0503 TaxID=2479203 RepID=UPI0018DF67EB|nr:FAD-dependent oxidoreductase [Deinococcus sp. DB0503]
MAIVNRKCNSIVELDHRPELLDSPTGRSFANEELHRCLITQESPPQESEIVIIGGGIIGCGIAAQLWHQDDLRNNFIILDSHHELCGNLFDTWGRIGQRVMRSPYDHHIAPDGDLQMLDFARLRLSELTEVERQQVIIGLSGQRAVVPVDIFIAHTRHVISTHALQDRSYRIRVKKIVKLSDSSHNYSLILDNGHTLLCNRVIVAAGNEYRELNGVWSRALENFPDQVSFCDNPQRPSRGNRILVVGSGMTSAHTLVNCYKSGCQITWLLRNEERYRCADFDTAFFRKEGIARFEKIPTLIKKRELLVEESRGSIMLEFYPILQELEHNHNIDVLRFIEPTSVIKHHDALSVHFNNGSSIEVDQVLLATGITPATSVLPKGVLLHDGRYPELDTATLELIDYSGVHVAGALASLVLGPAAKNVDGARLASQKIIPALQSRDQIQKSYTIRGTWPVTPPKRRAI